MQCHIQNYINSITEPVLQPMDLQLAYDGPEQLIFKWNKTAQCLSLRYEISATGCGICPNHTMNNNITCEEVSIETNSTEESLCMFAVKAVVCENNNKTSSKINVTLKGSVYLNCVIVYS